MTMKLAKVVRRRRAIGAIAAVAAAAATVGLAAPAMAAPAGSAARPLSRGGAASSSAVPWHKAGPGWALAMYSATREGEGVKFKAGPSTLYLISPQGSQYKLGTWSARNPRSSWYLLGWSGDLSRALFVTPPTVTSSGAHEHVDQMQLRTGRVTGFTLPADVTAVGYTRPDGLNILAEKTLASGSITLQRYSLTGKLEKVLATIKGLGLEGGWNGLPPDPYNPKGTELVGGAANGVVLISNAGGVIRKLSVPKVTEGCAAVRWWSPTTILASCGVTNEPGARMWLVPASGARPTALTPVRTGSNGFDLGDFNAWQLSSGLYVDGYGACGTVVIGRQPAHGKEQQINVPGSGSSLIVNATRSTLMVERFSPCMPGTSLVVFNPATRKMTVAISDRRHQAGVSEVVPFIAGKF
ncbi:MAG TPA: hypothetical protein VME44_03065 [Streptosporangiaceae bacterium]|nr:hypothetical protein [Streptosporangiaceae bacterium]